MQAALFASLEAYQEGMGIKQGLTIQSAILKKKKTQHKLFSQFSCKQGLIC